MLEWVNRFWPVIVGVMLCVLAFGETRVSVFFNTKDIEETKSSNRAQWQKLADHETRISKIEGRLQ